VPGEPARREVGDLLERARLLEQVRGAGNHRQLRRRLEPLQSELVEAEDVDVGASDDQQGGRPDSRQAIRREIGAAAAGHDGLDAVRLLSGRDKRRRGTGTGAEVTRAKAREPRLARRPIPDGLEPLREELDVEDIAAIGRLLVAEQVEQQRPQPSSVKGLADPAVARAQAAAAAAVREDHEARCAGGHAPFAREPDACGFDLD
jgi:hypothetical protein